MTQRELARRLADAIEERWFDEDYDPTELDVLDWLASAGLVLAEPPVGNPASDEYIGAVREASQ